MSTVRGGRAGVIGDWRDTESERERAPSQPRPERRRRKVESDVRGATWRAERRKKDKQAGSRVPGKRSEFLSKRVGQFGTEIILNHFVEPVETRSLEFPSIGKKRKKKQDVHPYCPTVCPLRRVVELVAACGRAGEEGERDREGTFTVGVTHERFSPKSGSRRWGLFLFFSFFF